MHFDIIDLSTVQVLCGVSVFSSGSERPRHARPCPAASPAPGAGGAASAARALRFSVSLVQAPWARAARLRPSSRGPFSSLRRPPSSGGCWLGLCRRPAVQGGGRAARWPGAPPSGAAAAARALRCRGSLVSFWNSPWEARRLPTCFRKYSEHTGFYPNTGFSRGGRSPRPRPQDYRASVGSPCRRSGPDGRAPGLRPPEPARNTGALPPSAFLGKWRTRVLDAARTPHLGASEAGSGELRAPSGRTFPASPESIVPAPAHFSIVWNTVSHSMLFLNQIFKVRTRAPFKFFFFLNNSRTGITSFQK